MKRSGVVWIMVVSLVCLLASTANATGAALLPDLAMARLGHFTIDTTTMPGHRLLRFTAIIVNNGAGPFEVRGSRASTADTMTATQRIFNDDGTYSNVPTTATMEYAGDGHNHWHVQKLETYRLTSVDETQTYAVGAKVGFCFRDSVAHNLSLPNAPQKKVYTYSRTCARDNPYALSVLEGLSVGWGDRYPYAIAYQWIDITSLPDGVYRVRAIADPNQLFTESTRTDNFTWTNVSIQGTSVSVVKRGPAW